MDVRQRQACLRYKAPSDPPAGLPIKTQLQYYASQFESAELNGVFYRTPTRDAVESWKEQTGKDFIFTWKASKFITHWKRLSGNSVNSLELLEDRLSILADKAGPVLFQLPPNFRADSERLVSFLRMLSQERRYSFEFRHPSWYTPRIMRLLSEANISLCISDHHDAPAPWKRTADFVYVRGHGPGGRYKGHYSTDALAAWAKRIKSWKMQGCDVFVFFDNDQKSAAPVDALQLKQMLQGGIGPFRFRNCGPKAALDLGCSPTGISDDLQFRLPIAISLDGHPSRSQSLPFDR
jgi:uncharacterized protein YecE (DUF72 family)